MNCSSYSKNAIVLKVRGYTRFLTHSSKGFLAGKLYECDIILIKHERLEYELMNRYKYYYDEAHRITERKYNYSKAVNLNGKNRPDKVDR